MQSLDEEEVAYWKAHIEAGNLYINRGITGAIVNRQPFGGMKRSAFGGGIKAGGPNYVSCFVEFTEQPVTDTATKHPLEHLVPEDHCKVRMNYAHESYTKAWKEEFSQEKDVNHIYGEENTFRYLPLKHVGLRVQENDELCDILLVLTASHMAGTPITVSIPENDPKLKAIKAVVDAMSKVHLNPQSEEKFIEEMDRYERIRACSPNLSDAIYNKAAKLGLHIASDKPLVEGRIELLNYLKEQSIAFEYHRYGSIFGEEK